MTKIFSILLLLIITSNLLHIAYSVSLTNGMYFNWNVLMGNYTRPRVDLVIIFSTL
jgi:hypothetical protein